MKKFKIGGILEYSVLAQSCMRQWKSPFESAERVISTALEAASPFLTTPMFTASASPRSASASI